ncbi:SBBP repeat-containing protein [bacterium]|nr:SBBP repeat-containing protein [bacterium]
MWFKGKCRLARWIAPIFVLIVFTQVSSCHSSTNAPSLFSIDKTAQPGESIAENVLGNDLPPFPFAAEELVSPQTVRSGSRTIYLDLDGVDYYAKSEGLETDPPALLMTAPPDGMSWAIYHFEQPYPNDQPKALTFTVNPVAPQFYMAFSNYETGNWDYQFMPVPEGYETIEAYGDYASFNDNGDLFVAVIAYDDCDFKLINLELMIASDKLAAPENFQASDGTFTDSIKLTWNRYTEAESYDIYRDDQAEPIAETTNGMYWLDNTAESMRVYEYYVVAKASGMLDSEPSNTDIGYIGHSPVAEFTFDLELDDGCFVVHFDASASHDNDATDLITAYQWDWDNDGTYDLTTDQPYVTHVYDYAVSHLTGMGVLDDEGSYDRTNHVIRMDGWTHTWGLEWEEYGTGVAVDSDGNVYVSCHTTSSYFDEFPVFLAMKYNNNGNLVWSKGWGKFATGYGYATDIALTSTGKVCVSGPIYGLGEHSGCDMGLVVFDSEGSIAHQWIWEGPADDYPRAIAIDNDDNIYLIGDTQSYGSGELNACAVKTNLAGELLATNIWSLDGDGSSSTYLNGTVDNANNLYVAGCTRENDDAPSDALLLKFNESGEYSWSTVWDCVRTENFYDIAIRPDGDVLVSGDSFDETIANGSDYAVMIQFSPGGQILRQDGVYGRFNCDINRLFVDSNGSCTLYGIRYISEFYEGWFLYEALYDSSGEYIQTQLFGFNGCDINLKDVARNSTGATVAVGSELYAAGEWMPLPDPQRPVNLNGTPNTSAGTYSNELRGKLIPISGYAYRPSGVEDTGAGNADIWIKQVSQPLH